MIAAELASWVTDARRRTLDLVADLDDQQLRGPRLAIVNPLLWEIGHVAWFQERWVLVHARGERPMRADGDALYDSARVAHDTRWDLALPSRAETLAYLEAVHERVLAALAAGEPDERLRYFVMLSVFHEDMHDEAFLYTRQTLAYPEPRLTTEEAAPREAAPAGEELGDALVPGGRFLLGAAPGSEPFVFDNEKWAHPVELAPFAIARRAVVQREIADFVDDGGYRERRWWSEEGWRWRVAAAAEQPVYWRRGAPGRWERRVWGAWRPIGPELPVVHVNAYEAEAYCSWAGRRLPTEAEWEAAAAGAPGAGGGLAGTRRRFPWGDAPPRPRQAHLDLRPSEPGASMGCRPAAELEAGESAFGLRQMIGNVWEWTASPFAPYPGFVEDPYREYSAPWFGTHRVLRGGAFMTRARLVRNTWRNFYTPERRDVWAGLRTCARDEPG